MHQWKKILLLPLCLLAAVGCSQEKPTAAMIADLKSTNERDRIVAVRLLQHRQGDAAQVVPALVSALTDKENDVRWSAAIGLGYFGAKAKEAIPALQTAVKDKDARVREAAGVALSRIDPENFSPPTAKARAQAK